MSEERRWPAAARAAALAFPIWVLLLLAERVLLDVRWDRFHLPAFDGHVYYTMAELPGVFSVAPWGYRVLTPWLAAALPTPQPTLAFAILTVGGLAATAALLVALGRVLAAPLPATLVVAGLFVVSQGTRDVLAYQFLADPLALALGSAMLLVALAGAGPGCLSVVVLLATAAKEANLALLPAVAALLAARVGTGRALRETALGALPALGFALALRLVWTPHLASLPAVDASGLPGRFVSTLSGWAGDLPFAVLLAAAGVGCIVGRGPRLPWLLAAGLSLLAPYLNPADFSDADLVRLRVHAWPGLAALALRPLATSLPAPLARTPRGEWIAWTLALVLALIPAGLVDGYRRLDLSGERDAPLVRATLRGTFDAAQRLAAGESVEIDPARPPRIEGREARPRWYLGPGWTAAQRAGTEPPRLPATGELIVPAPGQVALRVRLGIAATRSARLSAWLEDRPLPSVEIAPGESEVVFELEAGWLVRGDQRLRFSLRGGPVGLVRYALEPAPAR